MVASDKRLKILYLITKSNFGGAQRYVYDLATSMQALGHDVVVSFGGNGALATKLVEANIRTVPIPLLVRDVSPANDVRTFFRLLDLYAEESPDVVHLNSSKMGGLGALAARVYNAWVWTRSILGKEGKQMRIIFTGHGWSFNEERPDWQRFLIGCAHWLNIQLTHKTIAVSRKTREQISRLPLIGHKLVVVYNGVGEIAILPKDEAIQRIFGTKKDEWITTSPLIIGTLAELHKNKGLAYAIEGLAILKKQTQAPFVFVVLGDGEERTHLDAVVTRLELTHVVYLAGYKEGGVELLSAFDIFLLPSITEAFPYAILEAGNVGLPVIATSVGGVPEVIDDMQSGILIQSKNPGEVARAIAYMIEHPERRTQFGVAIKERIRGRFDLETMLKETLAVYRGTN